MRFERFILGVTLAASLAFGCDRNPQPAPTASGQSTPAVPTNSFNADATAAQPSVVLLIDGERSEFPPARLVVDDRNGKTVALLMSDDPPQAINDDYAGNSYYLEMEFDDLLPTVRGQVWFYEAPSTDKQDSPNGIFLQGHRQQLQPFQVKVQFQQIDGGDVAWVSGTFHLYASGARPQLPRVVSVTGRLPVSLPAQ